MKRDFITILALMTALSSCNDDALFEKEMYKNVVALISSDYYNTFEEVVTLSLPEKRRQDISQPAPEVPMPQNKTW